MIVVAVAVGVVLGGVIERLPLQRIHTKVPMRQLLVRFAVFMILVNLQRMIRGVQLFHGNAADPAWQCVGQGHQLHRRCSPLPPH